MTIFDMISLLGLLLLFAAVLALGYERQNGKIGRNKPQPTILMQLQVCRHELSERERALENCKYKQVNAEQTVEIYRALAEEYRAQIERLSNKLEND